MTSPYPSNRFTSLTDDEILYRYYSYDSLHYNIDLFKGFYEAYKKLGHGKDPLFHKKCSILKFEIVAKFCHYAEALKAFLYPCHNTVNLNLKSGDILDNLSKYRVDQIDQFYSDFNADTEYTLDNTKHNNFKQIFGYNHIISGQDADQFIDSSLVDITKVLKIIAEFYGFWKYSYNAYKHGYRLWFGYEHKQKLNIILHLKKYNKSSQPNDINRYQYRLPIDDKTIDDIHSLSKYCRMLYNT